MMRSFYGADVTKRYSANYADGSEFELHQIPEQKILDSLGCSPIPRLQSSCKDKQHLRYLECSRKPCNSWLSPEQLKSVIDVLEGNATSTTEYNQILSQADPEDVIFQEVATKTNILRISQPISIIGISKSWMMAVTRRRPFSLT